MNYVSTRDKKMRMSAAQAIVRGLAPDGGLMTPEVLPRLPGSALETMKSMSYQQRVVYVLSRFLDEFSARELTKFAAAAYGGNFDDPAVAPVRPLKEGLHCLELWHGPTCAFKDMALQMLPHLLSASLTKIDEEKTACILVATSGDTGKAALEGFKDVGRTKILVFYPKNGVSDIQELQMVTQAGGNVGVCAVVGNFDDAQAGVKKLFSDQKLAQTLADRGYFLSSANSINWGRVLPQIVYYVSVYCDLLKAETITNGQEINVCVPTGNFGNILAGYYAKQMGVPIKTLICASNENNVLTDFIRTGIYDKNRPFHNTLSPSMDILVSSNLERLIFELSGRNDELVREYMDQLASSGRYQVTAAIQKKVQELFAAGCCDDEQTKVTIAQVWKDFGYLIDPHTAVAFHVLEEYRQSTGDDTPAVVASTASPFKFCTSVLRALGVEEYRKGVQVLDQLSEYTGVPVPDPLAALKGKARRFEDVTEKEGMLEQVLEFLR
ncbi:MAG TPA: threonine synthase [Candidatus Enterenecus stercoripullorum]|nr:threonine synthase [Candidatus Enterenecus stercoripullorum]